MQKMERATIEGTPMKADPTFDRATVAKNLIGDLGKRDIPRGAKLLMVSPLDEIREGRIIVSPSFAEGGSYWDMNVRSAVGQGVGIKIFFPQIDTVVFADKPRPGNEDFYVFPYQWDGHLRNIEPAQYWTQIGVSDLETIPSFAFRCFENAVRSDSLYAEPYYYLARIYLSEAKPGPGAAALRKYVALASRGAAKDQAESVLKDLAARGY